MNELRIGSLCSGYGGLELGVQAVYGGTTAWVSDIDKGACKILAHRFPGVPNIGDMTAVKWTPDCPDCSAWMEVSSWDGDSPFYWCPSCQRCCDLSYREECPESIPEPVDLICGGTPCQDLSHAGKRAGMTEGTRSNLWVAMREAIAVIRPQYVVWENVRGAASAEADSDLVNDPRLLAGVRRRPGQPLLRALGRVVGDLSDLGYVGQVRGLRAADVGAPHGRFRYFIAATDAERGRRDGWSPVARRGTVGRAPAQGSGEGALLPSPRTSDTNGAGQHGEGGMDLRTAVSLLPTPRAGDGDKGGPNQRGSSGDLMLPSAVAGLANDAPGHLLPTPAVNDMGEGKTIEDWDAWTERMKAAHGNGNGHGAIEAQRLLPTLRVENNENRQNEGYGGKDGNFYGLVNGLTDWGQYAAAIARWESVTRPAPPPTEQGPKGNPRLAAAFSEWLMGLPAGWVTDVPGITRNEALRALGNGVVPQQAAEALRVMASWEVAA